MGMDNEKAHMSEQIQELTLLLMYLTSWQESSTPGLRRKPHKTDDTLLRRCWKGYDFSILERLEEQNLICGEGGKKPIVFTAEGERLAVELMKKYGFGDSKEEEVNDPTQFEQVDETCEFGGAVLYSESLDMTAFLGIDASRKI